MQNWIRNRPFLSAGIVFTPIALGIGYLTVGFGLWPGMTAARIVVPFACLAAGKYSGAIVVVPLVAVLQWPIYGFLIDRASRKAVASVVVLAVHIGLAIWLFLGPWERWQFQ